MRSTSPSLSPLLAATGINPLLRRTRKRLQMRLYSLNGSRNLLWRSLLLCCIGSAFIFVLSIELSQSETESDSQPRRHGYELHPRQSRHPQSLVSKRGTNGKDVYSHVEPYVGNAYHITTTIGPSKQFDESRYILTSLWFFEDAIPFERLSVQQIITPHAARLHFECIYGNREVRPAVGEVQGREEYYHVECDIPSWLATDLSKMADDSSRHLALQSMRGVEVALEAWIDLDSQIDDYAPPQSAAVRANPNGAGQQMLLARHLINKWEEPETRADVGICVSPLSFQAATSVTDVLEWRVFHKYQGIDRVHWYSRTSDFGAWVSRSNELLGVNDTYLDAPNLSSSTPHHMHHSDQAIWYQDCLLRYGIFDEWLAIIDVDEYLLPVNNASHNGARDRLQSLPADVATVLAFQTYYGGDRIPNTPRVEGFDQFPRNAFSHWEPNFILAGARFTKAIHRAIGTRMIWVHNVISRGRLYTEWKEDAQPDADGVLQVLHSRRNTYEDLQYSKSNQVGGPDWTTQWRDLAAGMSGLEELHILPSPT